MPMPLLLLPLMLAQTGPMVSGGAAPSLNLPEIDRPTGPNRRHLVTTSTADTPLPAPLSRLSGCLAHANADPDATVEEATAWLHETTGPAQAQPQLCLGTALSGMGTWDGAEAAFLAGRASADAGDHLLRGRLGAMAGNAALADGAPARALEALDGAASDAHAAQNPLLIGEIAIDRARALVALHREGDAAMALAEARSNAPDNALAWLLSATLSRRMSHLGDAQAQIETAARLDPTNPEVGLEAGVIAMLANHEDAARLSWQSVLTAAPNSEAGTQARAYLAELAASPAPAASTAPAMPASAPAPHP